MSYVKQTWQPGEPVTASKLNHMEDGISVAGQVVDNAMIKGVDYVTAGQDPYSTIGTGATAEGSNVNAAGEYSHAEGLETYAYGNYSHTEGNNSFTSSNAAHAEGFQTRARAQYSHAEGSNTQAMSDAAHAEGELTMSGYAAHAEGGSTFAISEYSHAEGTSIQAYCTVSGLANTTAYTYIYYGDEDPLYDHSYLLYNNQFFSVDYVDRSNQVVHLFQTLSEDDLTDVPVDVISYGALGTAAHSEGYRTVAMDYAHAEGELTIANYSSHAEGSGTKALGAYSHTQGIGTIASGSSQAQSASGKYNVADPGDNYAEIVGNGQDDNNRSNARTLDWTGKERLADTLEVSRDPSSNLEVATKQYVDNHPATVTSVAVTTGITGIVARKSGILVTLKFYDLQFSSGGSYGTLPVELRPKESTCCILFNPASALCGNCAVETNGNITIAAPSGVTQGYWYGQCVYFTN